MSTAKCPICGDPVPYAFYNKAGELYVDPPNHCIVSEGGVPFHMELGKDCWGKHTGYPNFTKKFPLEEVQGKTMRPERLFILNCIIALVSFAIVLFYDWPLEALGVAGFTWVFISTTSSIKALRRRNP